MRKLIPILISNDRSPLDVISNLVSALTSFSEGGQSDYQSLTTQTYPIFYQTTMERLESYLSGTVEKIKEPKERLNKTLKCLMFLAAMMKLNIKADESKKASTRQLSIALTQGRKMIERLGKAMPFLSVQFDDYQTLVLAIIKQVPASLRVFHIVCAHAKKARDSSLAEKVPKIMSEMESLNFKVKELCKTNNCEDAFSIGTF